VAAQVDLDRRREPAQGPVVAVAAHEGGLRDAQFEGDLLELVIGQGSFQQNDHRRVAALGGADEGVDPPEPVAEAHVDRFHVLEPCTPRLTNT
jgi:hypothetical protein